MADFSISDLKEAPDTINKWLDTINKLSEFLFDLKKAVSILLVYAYFFFVDKELGNTFLHDHKAVIDVGLAIYYIFFSVILLSRLYNYFISKQQQEKKLEKEKEDIISKLEKLNDEEIKAFNSILNREYGRFDSLYRKEKEYLCKVGLIECDFLRDNCRVKERVLKVIESMEKDKS
jgi:hypothetical protein